ncbi:MAG: ABC transporter substrate-binding protein [Rhodospirillaceae bacterium]|nr:ABC transporter substrate-binding protein [Rhodospirillaceae bacterium]
MKPRCFGKLTTAAFVLAAGFGTAQAEDIPVGHLATTSGETSRVAEIYGQGLVDAMAYINEHGGINGDRLAYESVDYGYDALQAVATYADWRERIHPVVVLGWGTADTEALVPFITEDEVVFISGSSSGHLTDPTGRSPHTEVPAPYNFFYGPSYSDACRGLVQWAAQDWRRTRGANTSTFLQDLTPPRFVHMGDNHPYPNSPREACADFARDLGFEVLDPIRYALAPGDFRAHCEALRQSGADYVFLGNTSDSNVALVRDCARVGVNARFMTNIYGWDELAIEDAGEAGNGMVWEVSAGTWNDTVPGMALVREVSAMSDPDGELYRPVHYMRGVCTAFFMRDAMVAAADMEGGVTGPNIRAAFEQMQDHVPEGLEGVCLPSTWTAEDHRGSTEVVLYQSNYSFGQWAMDEIFSTNIPLRPDWLGW